MTKTKKLLSTFLAVIMVLSIFSIVPLTASAGTDEVFQTGNPDDYTAPDNMLYVLSSTSGPLKQRVEVVPGASYYFAFGLSNNSPEFTVVGQDKDRNSINLNSSEVAKINAGNYTLYKYSVTIPEDIPVQSKKYRVFIGLSFAADTEIYAFDFSLTKTDAATNILSNGTFETNLNDWAWGEGVWFTTGQTGGKGKTEWEDDNVTIKIIPFNESLFGGTPAEDQMLYFSAKNTGPLMTRRTLVPGAQYNISFGLSNSVTSVDLACKTDDDRKNISIEKSLLSKEDKGTYSIYNYTFTYPETAPADFAFIGFTFPANSEGYIFDIKMTVAGEETQMISNGDFKAGLDHWAWDWDAWFESWSTGLNKTEWSNENVSLGTMAYDESKFAALMPEPAEDQMLYFSAKNAGPLMTRRTLVPGTQYNISFGLSNSVTSVDVVCRTNDDRKNISIEKSLVSKENKGTYSIYNYTFTYPETAPADFAFIGFTFPLSKEGYIFDVKLWAADDEGEVQKISNGDFKSGLDHWAWDWDAWFESWSTGLKKTEWSNDNVSLATMPFDESKFEELLPQDKMLYFSAKNNGPLMTRRTLVPGTQYNISFGLSGNVTSVDLACKTDDDRKNISIEKSLVSKENKGTYSIYNYTFTYPANGPDDFAFIGFTFPANSEGYIFDIKMTVAGEETQKISNGDFKSGLDHWAWDWDAWFESWSTGLKKTEWSNSNVTLNVMPFDESKFEELLPQDKMLYFSAKNAGPLMTRRTLVPGTQYNISFGLSNSVTSLDVVCRTNDDRKNISIEKSLVSKEDKGTYSLYNYTFAYPENGPADFAFVGFIFNSNCEGYIFDIKMTVAGEETQKISNGDFQSGLDHWAWDWDAWFESWSTGKDLTEWSNENVTLAVMAYNESKFESLIPEPVKTQMLYFKGKNAGPLMTRRTLVPGAQYNISFSLSNNITTFDVVCRTNDDRKNISIEKSLVGKEDKGTYTVYNYAFTYPENGPDDFAFVGFTFTSDCEGYIFDIKMTVAGEETQKISNGDFQSGLDHWAWDWDAWFESWSTGKNLTEWSNENVTLNIMDFDESKFESLIPKKQMLYFKGNNSGPLMVRRNLISGKEYKLSFGLSSNVLGVDIICKTDDDRNNISIEKELLSKENLGAYTIYTYAFTYPSTKEDGLAFVGFKFQQNCEGYIFDVKMWAVDDTTEKQLISNGDFQSGLNHWAWDWDAWFESWADGLDKTEWSNENVTLNVMEYDESKFNIEVTYIPGDINNDSSINNKDLTRLFQYLSGWNVDVNIAALDVNGDGSVNNKDLTRLFQYLSGWNVDIF